MVSQSAISRELIVKNGRQFIVQGNPAIGYELVEIEQVAHRGEHRRKWEAVAAVDEITKAGV